MTVATLLSEIVQYPSDYSIITKVQPLRRLVGVFVSNAGLDTDDLGCMYRAALNIVSEAGKGGVKLLDSFFL